MKSLFVRQTHWDIPCKQSSIHIGITALHQALKVSGIRTTAAESTDFFCNDWQEFKAATHAGRQVLLLLEVCRGEARFSPFYSATLSGLVLRQREYRFHLKDSGRFYTYSLFGYMPFRSEAYRKYQQSRTLNEKQAQLGVHLCHHLGELASRIGGVDQGSVRVEDIRIRKEKKVRLGGVLQASFDLQFKTKLFIPEFFGLGRGASTGLGVIRPLR